MTQQTFFRAFPATIQQRGPRQLTGRLVPYNLPADVLDELPTGKVDIYREGFRRGAFDGQLQTGTRNKGVFTKIGLIHRHDGGLGYLGPFTRLREEADGLWGDVNVLPTKADDVGALLEDGIDELSIEFRLRPGADSTIVDEQGVRWRTRVHLDQVALEPKGAYSTAQVLQYRAAQDEMQEQEQAEEEAERQRLADEAEKAEAALAVRDAERERKRLADEMAQRLEAEVAKQEQLVKEYGLTLPPPRVQL